MRRFLTKDEAIKHANIADGCVHCFRNPAPAVLLGADISASKLEAELDAAKSIEIGGDQCQAMSHAIVIDGKVFVANKPSLYELEVKPPTMGDK